MGIGGIECTVEPVSLIDYFIFYMYDCVISSSSVKKTSVLRKPHNSIYSIQDISSFYQVCYSFETLTVHFCQLQAYFYSVRLQHGPKYGATTLPKERKVRVLAYVATRTIDLPDCNWTINFRTV